MQNYDEMILRRRRIDPAAPYPVMHQAVRIAIYDEYAGRSFYGKVIEAFGPRPPFVNIVHAEQRHIDALSRICERDDFRRFATGFKVLDDYFRNYLRANFPEHMLPEEFRNGGERKKDRA